MVSLRTAIAPLAILAASSSLVDALPSPVRLSGSVRSVTNSDGTVNEAALQRNLDETFAKLEVRDSASAAPVVPQRRLGKKCSSGTAAVALDGSIASGLGYSGEGTIGTPAQPVSFIFDTGSYDMLVQSTTKNGGAAYDVTKSTTYTSESKDMQFNYVTGSYNGKLVSDTVSVGGLSVPKQVFGVIESNEIGGVSGILGLGIRGQGVIGQPNFLDNLVAAGKLAANKVDMYLSPRGGSGAEVILGGVNTARYTGALETLVNQGTQAGRWMLNLKNVYVDKKFIGSGRSEALVIIDSGSTVSYLPKAFVTALHKKIPGAVLDDANSVTATFAGVEYKVDRWTIPCNSVKAFGFAFNTSFHPLARQPVWEISPEDLVLAPMDDGSDTCATTLFGVDIEFAGFPVGILGIPFLRNQYTIFDYGSTDSQPSISFGKLA